MLLVFMFNDNFEGSGSPEWTRVETVFVAYMHGNNMFGLTLRTIFNLHARSPFVWGSIWYPEWMRLESCFACIPGNNMFCHFEDHFCSNAWKQCVLLYFWSLWYLELMCLETVFCLYARKYNVLPHTLKALLTHMHKNWVFYATLKASDSPSGRVWKGVVGCSPGKDMFWHDLKATFTQYAWKPNVLQNFWNLW